ncbi:hypothetical protein KL86DES1_20855 [uncultured Desulfovibrio sp.]|uniref:Uncharacterized protein n=1 Tax=uncultured Desulfovibrio sp. TaxID=167968 RepID=A0A212L5M0_9BACT|nr:hypothetical protein KL86DES1_20855 [uncultured Desulfovibrio sp.]VZH33758.1 conserved protein of unknown function [Desulfovibrio sp. 86]
MRGRIYVKFYCLLASLGCIVSHDTVRKIHVDAPFTLSYPRPSRNNGLSSIARRRL